MYGANESETRSIKVTEGSRARCLAYRTSFYCGHHRGVVAG